MASIWAKFKELAGIEELETDSEPEEERNPYVERRSVDMRPPYHSDRTIKPEFKDVDPKDKVISMNKTLNAITSRFDLVVTEPSCFDECPKLVDSLKARKPIIINLEKVETDVARKIFDFLSGATYALNGNMQKIANNIFVFVPENVNVSAPPEHSGIDFSSAGTKGPWR
ncbi:MAG: cell division protein SepF [Clostridiales Family XIII bacterium]|jgi:cell division inhibitor SepF|nr:cell division protein SepF [Clostridiales Family XIII bacterium]